MLRCKNKNYYSSAVPRGDGATCDYASKTWSERKTPRGHLFTVISRICNESSASVEFTKQSPPLVVPSIKVMVLS